MKFFPLTRAAVPLTNARTHLRLSFFQVSANDYASNKEFFKYRPIPIGPSSLCALRIYDTGKYCQFKFEAFIGALYAKSRRLTGRVNSIAVKHVLPIPTDIYTGRKIYILQTRKLGHLYSDRDKMALPAGRPATSSLKRRFSSLCLKLVARSKNLSSLFSA